MDQAQPTPAAAPAPSTNAKSIWSIVAYLSWVGALVTAYKKRDAFHMWHAKVSVGVSVLYFVVYAIARVIIAAMPTAGFIRFLGMAVNLFGFVMFVLTIIAVLKAWKGEQWGFMGLAKVSQKVPLEKLFPADGSAPAVATAVDAPAPAPAPEATTPVETPVTTEAPVAEVTPEPVQPAAPAEAPAQEPTVEAAPTPEVPAVTPVVETSEPVEVEVEQAPDSTANDAGISIEPVASEQAAPAAMPEVTPASAAVNPEPEQPVAPVEAPSAPQPEMPTPEAPASNENPTPPTT